MSSWSVTDDTPTAAVVRMAAEKIGKAQNHEQLQKICTYLVNKHWFQTAGDLRSARCDMSEWQALEVPGRLKLAIQEVLEEYHELELNYDYDYYYKSAKNSSQSTCEYTIQEESSVASVIPVNGATEEVDQATIDYYSSDDGYTNSGTSTDLIGADYNHDQTDNSAMKNLPLYVESSRAINESFYSPSAYATGTFNCGEAATASLNVQRSIEQWQLGEDDVVEATAVEAEACLESELAFDQLDHASELSDQFQQDAGEFNRTWSCTQCTIANLMTSSSCEMCIDHSSQTSGVNITSTASGTAITLTTAAPTVDEAMNLPLIKNLVSFSNKRSLSPDATNLLPSKDLLYSPSAPDYESLYNCEDELNKANPLPSLLPNPGTSSCESVDFLALAFNNSIIKKAQAPIVSPLKGKNCHVWREGVTNYN